MSAGLRLIAATTQGLFFAEGAAAQPAGPRANVLFVSRSPADGAVVAALEDGTLLSVLEAGTVTLRAKVRADYDDRIYDYLLRYEGSVEGGLLTVEEPRLIQGVEAEVTKTGVLLRYDGVLLETGPLLGDLSPLEAFPLLLRAWQSGSVTDCFRELWEGTPCLRAELDLTPAGETEKRTCLSWFRSSDGKPLHAELLSEDRTVLFCDFLAEEPAGA